MTSKYAHITVDEMIAEYLADTQFRDMDMFNEPDFFNWIWRAEELIGSVATYIESERELEVDNFRALLPCDLYKVIQLVDKCTGRPLYWNGGTKKYFHEKHGKNILSNHGNSHEFVFSINNWYVDTNMPKGMLTLFYYSFPTDDKGRPMVKNTVEHIEAVVAFIKWKLAAVETFRNFDKNSLEKEKYYNSQWLLAKIKARSQDNMPDISELQYLSEIHNRMITRVDGFATGFRSLNQNDQYNQNANSRNDASSRTFISPGF